MQIHECLTPPPLQHLGAQHLIGCRGCPVEAWRASFSWEVSGSRHLRFSLQHIHHHLPHSAMLSRSSVCTEKREAWKWDPRYINGWVQWSEPADSGAALLFPSLRFIFYFSFLLRSHDCDYSPYSANADSSCFLLVANKQPELVGRFNFL